MKVEFYNRYLWSTKATAKLAVGDRIERVYNRRRPHSAIGMIPPAEYETRSIRRHKPPDPAITKRSQPQGVHREGVRVAGMSPRGRRAAGVGDARTDGVQRRLMVSSRTRFIAMLVVLLACVPVMNFLSSSDTHLGHVAGASHHDQGHDHGQNVALAAQLGLVVAADQVVAAHPHLGALRELVNPGVDGVVAAVRAVNPSRMLALLVVLAMALAMVAFAGLNRSRAPPVSRAWLGPARPGRVVIADLCVIRR